MIKNYLIVAMRNLVRNRTFSAINILGLAIGMACCFVILLYVQDELSYDKHHVNADRIYRLVEEAVIEGKVRKFAVTSYPMGPTLVKDYPEVEAAVRFMKPDTRLVVKRGEKSFYEEGFLFADASVLDVFTFPLVKGNPQTALQEPYSVLITEQTAQKYFGLEDPMGQMLKIDNKFECKITGVLKDIPRNAHFQCDFLASFDTIIGPFYSQSSLDWLNHSFYTYLMLQKGTSAANLEQKLPAFIKTYLGEEMKMMGGELKPFLQPLTDIHLHSHLEAEMSANGDVRYVYLFACIAFFVLLLACINFMNLSTARALGRSREVGMRKVVGATRTQLIRQFLGESMLLTFFALGMALFLVELVLPTFNAFLQRDLSFERLGYGQVGLLFVVMLLFVGVLAGSYPALFLSAFQPMDVFKDTLGKGSQKSRVRKALVVFQFAISIVLIIGTGVVYEQSDYIRNKRLGFNKEHVVVMPFTDKKVIQQFQSKLLSNPHILSTSSTSAVPGRQASTQIFRPGGDASHQGLLMDVIRVDRKFIQTLGLELVDGRNFSEEIAGDAKDTFILNEAAVEKLGWDSAIGRKFENVYPTGGKIEVEHSGDIVGVVKNFHYKSLHHKVEPLVIMTTTYSKDYVAIRIRPDQVSNTLDFLKEQWADVAPYTPFEYSFLNEDYDTLYRAEDQMGKLFGFFALFAIFVASLGVLGLASFAAQQRLKEVGIRKVLGASIFGIIMLLSKEFLVLVGVANLVSWPLAYYVLTQWLQNFAYRMDMGVLPFVLGGFLTLVIAMSTVSYQAWKAARINPVDALKYE